MKFACNAFVPNLDADGRPAPGIYGAQGREYWECCDGQFEIPTPGSGNALPIRSCGTAPVAITTIVCPRCGRIIEILDMGRLDGVKKTRKADLYSATHKPKRRSCVVAYSAFEDGHMESEVFFTDKAAKLALPRLRYADGVIKESIYLQREKRNL